MTIDTIIFIVFKSEETEEWNPENRWVDGCAPQEGTCFTMKGMDRQGWMANGLVNSGIHCHVCASSARGCAVCTLLYSPV